MGYIQATSEACYDSETYSTDTFSPPYDGTIVGIKLVHTSGYTKCNGDSTETNFGCDVNGDGSSFFHLQTLMIDSNSTYYPTTSTDGVSLYYWTQSQWTCNAVCDIYWYDLTGYDAYSDEIILTDTSNPYTVSTTDVFSLQMSEGCCLNPGDNDGKACAEVWFYYTDS